MKTRNYQGLVLFDIDGTLSTGTENEKVVQYFLNNNYAVGISTAGPMYNPKNILNFSWMPKNLGLFMVENNFATFNNVITHILCGKFDPTVYNTKIGDISIYDIVGWNKGLSMKKTAELYNITDPKKIILFDNDPNIIRGGNKYNKEFSIICAGQPCSNRNLSMDTVRNLFHQKKPLTAGTFNLFNL